MREDGDRDDFVIVGAPLNKCFIVLGMHRSATSLIAKGLREEGVFMGNRILEPNEHNKEGYWEDLDFLYLNKRILEAAGGSWDNPPTEEAILNVKNKFKVEILRKVQARKNSFKMWGWKDPRTILTIKLFLPYIQRPHFICCFRGAVDVANSLAKVGDVSFEKGLELADIYNNRLLKFMGEQYGGAIWGSNMGEHKVSVIIPVIRSEKAARCKLLVEKYAGIPKEDFEVIMEEDTERIGCPKMVKKLVAKTKYDNVCFLGDDTMPTQNFLKEALVAMQELPDGWGLVGINDGVRINSAAHWVASKKLLPYLNNEFFHTGYTHSWCDNELKDIAEKIGRFIWAEDSQIIHEHPIAGDNVDMEDYANVYAQERIEKDEVLYRRRRIQRDGFKLGIALPLTSTQVYTQFMFSFLTMNKPDFQLLVPEGAGNIDTVRNGLVSQALRNGCSHLAFMDTDQIYPQDALMKLLDHDKPFVSGVVHRRYSPFDPILYWYEDGTEKGFIHVPLNLCYSGDLIKIDATGQGFTLTKMETFLDVGVKNWFKTERRKEDNAVVGEDIAFCTKLRELGIEMYADTSIKIPHLSLFEVTQGTHELFMKNGSLDNKWASPSSETVERMMCGV